MNWGWQHTHTACLRMPSTTAHLSQWLDWIPYGRVQFGTGWSAVCTPWQLSKSAHVSLTLHHLQRAPHHSGCGDNASPTAFQAGLMTAWISNIVPSDCSTLSFFFCRDEKGLSAVCDGIREDLILYFPDFPSHCQQQREVIHCKGRFLHRRLVCHPDRLELRGMKPFTSSGRVLFPRI